MQVVLKLYERRWVIDVKELLHIHRALDGSFSPSYNTPQRAKKQTFEL
jgi:hypothetical protein